MQARWLMMGGLVTVLVFASGAQAEPPADHFDFDVEFSGCTEYVGIGLVPAAPARALVPAEYRPVEVGDSAILVVRVSACEAVEVDGKPAHPGQVAQVGISVAGLDGSADINNYTLVYVTDSGQLHGKLQAAGVPVALDAQLRYAFDGTSGQLEGLVDAPHTPLISLTGTAVPPSGPPTTFIASWWSEGTRGRFRMRTAFPAIVFSEATVTLTTDVGSDLETLIGALPFSFPFLDSYNAFDNATMEVRAAP